MRLRKIDIRLEGPDIQPESIPVGELLDLLLCYERLLRDLTGKRHSKVERKHREMRLRLVSVERGSTTLSCLAPEELYNANRTISQAIGKGSDLPPEARDSFFRLRKRIEKLGCDVKIQGEDLEPFAISRERVPTKRFIRGETTVYGECIAVGGRKAVVKLVSGSGAQIRIRLSNELAREIAKHLYEEIGVRGLATWEVSGPRIVDMEAYELLPYRRTSPKEAIQALQESAGKDWGKIADPEEFLRKLRRE